MRELWRIFHALGDPSRLEMLNRLATLGPLPMNRLSEGMPFSRQGGAKHLAVLAEVGLISVKVRGREKVVSLQRENFHLGEMFLRQMEAGWDERLARLELEVNKPE